MTRTHLVEGILDVGTPQAPDRGSYMRVTRYVALPNVVLVLALPFIVDAVGSPAGRVGVLALAMVMVPLLALQAWSQNYALEALIAAVGDRMPHRMKMRREHYGTAMLMSVAAVMQSVAVIVAVRVGYLPAQGPTDRGILFNAALILIAIVVVVGPFERLKRGTLLVGVAVVIALGHLGLVDATKIALWEAMFTTLILLMVMRTITSEMLDLGEMMVAAGADAAASTETCEACGAERLDPPGGVTGA